jgi:membrane protein DedA with SNARE-associated domain
VYGLVTLGGALTHLVQHYGLAVLAATILIEAVGIPVPGETALIAAAILAQQGHLEIAAVIGVAAAAACVGGMIGFAVGRHGGRWAFDRWEQFEGWTRPVVGASERYFARHGAKTVFVARFLPVLRVTAAWMAGIGKMSWWRFVTWNTAGAVAWALAIGLLVYFAGDAAGRAIREYGVYGAIAVGIVIVLVIAALHVWRRRLFA